MGRVGSRQPVVRHRQADVVVVAVGPGVVGPADGQDVLLGGGVLGEVVMADDSSVSAAGEHERQGLWKKTKTRLVGAERPAVSCEVVVCDAGSSRRLVVGDVGRHQGSGVEADVSDGMPADDRGDAHRAVKGRGCHPPPLMVASHLLCISHSFAPILVSHTHTSPSPPPLTIFQSSPCTEVTPR